MFRCDISSDEGYAYAKTVVENTKSMRFLLADMPAIGAIKYFNEQKSPFPNKSR